MKARLRNETWQRLRLIAQAEKLSSPLAALDHVVGIASAKLWEAEQERIASARSKAKSSKGGKGKGSKSEG